MTSKATGYIDQLDKARCEGNWSAVPELVRKVRKHAPDRSCLTLTAETECAISKVTAAAATPTSPTGPEKAQELDVSSKLPRLLDAIEKETQHVEDRFQAQVCLGWLHWVVAEYSLAASRLPNSSAPGELDLGSGISEWTTICALKSAYLKANCLTRNYNKKEALDAYKTGLPALAQVSSGHGIKKQLAYWSELFLTEYCMLMSDTLQEDEVSLQDANSIACFRSWARYWEAMPGTPAGGHGFKGSVPRRRIWVEYYTALSRIVQDDLPFPTGYAGKITNEMSARAQLRVELKAAEASYQSLLLGETTFPRADEQRAEVETFVKLVVKNWSTLCGRGWREQDLGPGGRNSLSRGVLDILYAAATRTYHSTAILRFLFTVHLSVAEFELAFKAFDSYMEIVKKGKARVDKTGHLEPNLDEDGTVLETMAQAVIALCQYGHKDVAEKARQLGAELEDWLSKLPQLKPAENGIPVSTAEHEDNTYLHPPIAPEVVALSWQAIGLAHAHWSRITHEASLRTEIQGRAIRCLKRSLATEFGRSKDIRSFFALGLLLAERRELTAAIDVVKTGLIASKGCEEQYHLSYGNHWLERSLIPMWHLLALLLSARQDFMLAARACEGALEQFKDPVILFGKEDANFKSEHLNATDSKNLEKESRKGLVDEMDDLEKLSILEVKMTQLTLVELFEGPDVAVNASYELLTLFSRLFGNISPQSILKPTKPLEPPKTSRSIRGSIFGGKDKSRTPTREPSNASTPEKAEVKRPLTAQTTQTTQTAQTTGSVAPAIQVTGENGGPASRRGSSALGNRQRSSSRQRTSLTKRQRSVSRNRTPSVASQGGQATVVDGEPYFTPAPIDTEQSDFFTYSSKRQTSTMSSASRGRTLQTLNSYNSTLSKSTEYSVLTAEKTYASTNLLPLIQFPKDKERSTRTTILIRVWLMIAGFYRRAEMFDDCKGAATEAQKLVQSLEADGNREPSGTSGMKSPGWAESKSVEDLWGDVYNELGLLSLAEGSPYEARSEFESALMHSPDHPAAIVGLSNILLDVYNETLRPSPLIPLVASSTPSNILFTQPFTNKPRSLPTHPLGLCSPLESVRITTSEESDSLPEPYKATQLPLVDRLAARDRASALLSGLTRLGSGWNYSKAWFALARAHEESGQSDKAKEVLWWCIELEEATGVRDWRSVGGGGYVI